MVTVTPEHGGTHGDTLTWRGGGGGGSKCGRENEEGKKRQCLREGLEPATWQMACYALTC